ncbi:hypothetical protein LEMLEM_LOCUS1393 [Lemmus lemmus]
MVGKTPAETQPSSVRLLETGLPASYFRLRVPVSPRLHFRSCAPGACHGVLPFASRGADAEADFPFLLQDTIRMMITQGNMQLKELERTLALAKS